MYTQPDEPVHFIVSPPLFLFFSPFCLLVVVVSRHAVIISGAEGTAS